MVNVRINYPAPSSDGAQGLRQKLHKHLLSSNATWSSDWDVFLCWGGVYQSPHTIHQQTQLHALCLLKITPQHNGNHGRCRCLHSIRYLSLKPDCSNNISNLAFYRWHDPNLPSGGKNPSCKCVRPDNWPDLKHSCGIFLSKQALHRPVPTCNNALVSPTLTYPTTNTYSSSLNISAEV